MIPIINFIRIFIMGAIAVSDKEEQQIERLRKTLRIRTKSGVVRAALKRLEESTEEGKLRDAIQESVRRCGAADARENQELFLAGVAHRNSGA
jgi:Arc/MetJ-type ribon-helix-helix transcriptional regulator